MKICCIVLAISVLLLALYCIEQKKQLDDYHAMIEHKAYQTCVNLSTLFRRGEYDEYFVQELGALEIYSSLSKTSDWDIFHASLRNYANEDAFNSLTYEARLYIADTLFDLISQLPAAYEDVYFTLFEYTRSQQIIAD